MLLPPWSVECWALSPEPASHPPTPLLQVHHMVQDVGSDFYTGVSAALITRNNNPAWVPASLKDVSGVGGR